MGRRPVASANPLPLATVTVEVPQDQAADLRRALDDPQVWRFVIQVGRLLRPTVPEESLLQFIEQQLYHVAGRPATDEETLGMSNDATTRIAEALERIARALEYRTFGATAEQLAGQKRRLMHLTVLGEKLQRASDPQ